MSSQPVSTPSPLPSDELAPLREFVVAATVLAGRGLAEEELISEMRPLFVRLVASGDWLPADAAQPHPDRYSQYLLHCDPLERFSVVSFVWGPAQQTPIHDHTVWGLIGMLRGAETGQRYMHDEQGRLIPQGQSTLLQAGDVELVSPNTGDIHQVSNAFDDRVSISVHLYGANIGAVARHVFDPLTGHPKTFVSGYSSPTVPNLWDRSAFVRASAPIPGASRR